MDPVRIDKWLWAVRLFKTRSQATDACKSGKIKIDGQVVKASREVKLNDEISFLQGPLFRTVLVTGIIGKRVGARIAVENYDDLTPQEEYDKVKLMRELNFEYRDRGTGRPTKKERRIITKLKNTKE